MPDHTEITPPAKCVEDCSRPARCRLRTTDTTNHGGVCQFLITRQVGTQFLQLNMFSLSLSSVQRMSTAAYACLVSLPALRGIINHISSAGAFMSPSSIAALFKLLRQPSLHITT